MNDLDSKFLAHEAVCAERYQTFINRVDRLEHLMIRAAGGLIIGMAGLIVTILLKGH